MLCLLRRFKAVLEDSGWLIYTVLLLSSLIIAIPQEVLSLPVSAHSNPVGQNNTENVTSIICSGLLTLNTITTIQWTFPIGDINPYVNPFGVADPLFPSEKLRVVSWLSFVEKRSSTITIPFTVNLNHSYTSNVEDPNGRMEGDIWGWSNSTVSWIGDWSITNMSGLSKFIFNTYNFTLSFEYIPTSVSPGSGDVFGNGWVEVSGLYRNGQVFFNFNPILHDYAINTPGGFTNYWINYTFINGILVPEDPSLPDSPMVWRYNTLPDLVWGGREVWDPTYDGMNVLCLASGGVGLEGWKGLGGI